MFQLVKTPWKWNPTRFPGMAYEVIYVLRKTGEPKHVATLETAEGVVEEKYTWDKRAEKILEFVQTHGN